MTNKFKFFLVNFLRKKLDAISYLDSDDICAHPFRGVGWGASRVCLCQSHYWVIKSVVTNWTAINKVLLSWYYLAHKSTFMECFEAKNGQNRMDFVFPHLLYSNIRLNWPHVKCDPVKPMSNMSLRNRVKLFSK